MTVQAPATAPSWAHDFAKDLGDDIAGQIGPFVSLKPFTLLDRPSATKYPWKMIFLSNGAGNKFVAVSNGLAWYYLEGTAV